MAKTETDAVDAPRPSRRGRFLGRLTAIARSGAATFAVISTAISGYIVNQSQQRAQLSGRDTATPPRPSKNRPEAATERQKASPQYQHEYPPPYEREEPPPYERKDPPPHQRGAAEAAHSEQELAARILKSMADRIVGEQAPLIAKARQNLQTGAAAEPASPYFDRRVLLSREGDIWGSIAPRASISERRGRSSGAKLVEVVSPTTVNGSAPVFQRELTRMTALGSHRATDFAERPIPDAAPKLERQDSVIAPSREEQTIMENSANAARATRGDHASQGAGQSRTAQTDQHSNEESVHMRELAGRSREAAALSRGLNPRAQSTGR